MKKFKNKVGYVVYEATAEDIKKIGGFGICDSCNEHSQNGYLIPVMNRWFCPKCYEEWNSRARMYPEDLSIEAKNVAYYDKVFNI
jgi:hypothetical protein